MTHLTFVLKLSAQRIKDTPGITGLFGLRDHIDIQVRHLETNEIIGGIIFRTNIL